MRVSNTPEESGPPSTPTHSCDGSEGSAVRRSPRCKDSRTPYYLPLSDQPVNIGTPGSGRMSVPDSCSPHPARREPASVTKKRADEFRCPPLPSRPESGAQQAGASPASAPQQSAPQAACTRQQPDGDANDRAAGKRGVAAQQDQSLVICLSESPDNEVEASRGRRQPRAESMRPSRSLANPSCSESDSGAAGSQSTGGRQRRATAAAAMLRIKGKMKPPSNQFDNLSQKQVLAAVSAAVSAVQSNSQQASQVVKEDCATSAEDTKPTVRARATRSATTTQSPSASKSTGGRKRRQDVVGEQSICTEPDRKKLAVQRDSAARVSGSRLKHEHNAAGEVEVDELEASIVEQEQGKSQQVKQQRGSARKGGSGAKPALAKGRNAKDLVQAVVKATDPCAAAPPPQRGRAAVKLRQENARAAAAKGKLLPAAVPAMHAPAMMVSSTAGVKRKAPKAPAPVEDMFPCGTVAWTDAEVARLQHVCTHKVPPSSLRYWQQVALHMPGRTITDCYEKFNERHAAPKRKGRIASAPAAAPAVGKDVGDAEPKTECQKRKYVRKVRWELQHSQQNDPERLQELMRQQKAADACIDALRRKRPNTKPQPVVGTISKPPPAFPVFVGLDDEDPQSDLGPGSVPPKVCTKPLRQTPSELPDISEALQVMHQAREALLESPDADFYFSDGLSE